MKGASVSAVLLSVGLATKVILSNAAGVSCKLLLKVNPCRGHSDPLFKIERYRKIIYKDQSFSLRIRSWIREVGLCPWHSMLRPPCRSLENRQETGWMCLKHRQPLDFSNTSPVYVYLVSTKILLSIYSLHMSTTCIYVGSVKRILMSEARYN